VATSGKLTVKLDDAAALAKLHALDAAAGNMQPVYATIGAALVNRIRLCFKLGVDPWNKPWQALKWRAPAVKQAVGKYGGTMDERDKAGNLKLTAKGRKQLAANEAGKAGQPLRDTGLLQRSISAAADPGGVTVGTNLRQARIHQFGGVIKPVKKPVLVFPGPTGELIFAKKVTIPARPYLPLRRYGAAVELPPAWALLVTRAVKAHLAAAIETETA
jgi:phage gpG-like protein